MSRPCRVEQFARWVSSRPGQFPALGAMYHFMTLGVERCWMLVSRSSRCAL